ncbi:MAG TPA: hypothetical protein VIL12_00740 [Acidimicrobiia bacterium]
MRKVRPWILGLLVAAGCSLDPVTTEQAIVGDWTAVVVIATEHGPLLVDVTTRFLENGRRELVMEGDSVVPPQARYWFEDELLFLDGCEGVPGSYRAAMIENGRLRLKMVDDPCLDRVAIYQREWTPQ